MGRAKGKQEGVAATRAPERDRPPANRPHLTGLPTSDGDTLVPLPRTFLPDPDPNTTAAPHLTVLPAPPAPMSTAPELFEPTAAGPAGPDWPDNPYENVPRKDWPGKAQAIAEEWLQLTGLTVSELHTLAQHAVEDVLSDDVCGLKLSDYADGRIIGSLVEAVFCQRLQAATGNRLRPGENTQTEVDLVGNEFMRTSVEIKLARKPFGMSQNKSFVAGSDNPTSRKTRNSLYLALEYRVPKDLASQKQQDIGPGLRAIRVGHLTANDWKLPTGAGKKGTQICGLKPGSRVKMHTLWNAEIPTKTPRRRRRKPVETAATDTLAAAPASQATPVLSVTDSPLTAAATDTIPANEPVLQP